MFAFSLLEKISHKIFLLRWDHEFSSVSRIYCFFYERKRRYSIKPWNNFADYFNCLPIAAAIIDYSIFCCRGGLSPELTFVSQIKEIIRPTEVHDYGIIWDVL